MNLETQINDGIKQAMLSKEKVRLAALRAIKAEILLAKTADGSDEISDAAVLKIIQKLVKQRKESATVYAENNRPELAENELAEATCLEVFLGDCSAGDHHPGRGEVCGRPGQSNGFGHEKTGRTSRRTTDCRDCKETATIKPTI